jgi:hypothetical protein
MSKMTNGSKLNTDQLIKKIRNNNLNVVQPLEQGKAFKEYRDEKNVNQSEVARQAKTNRMTVSNGLTLATITPEEEVMINNKIISKTEWIKLAKRVPNVDTRIKYLKKATPTNIDNPARLTADKVMIINGDSTRSSKVRTKRSR